MSAGVGTGDTHQAAAAPPRRRERERADARFTILAAARALAREQGWDAVTMRGLAERIDYSANFAYRYFTGRDDILLALVRDGFTQLREALITAAAHPTEPGGVSGSVAGTPQTAAVRRSGHAYLDFALAERDLYQVMYGLGAVRVPTADTLQEGQAVGDVLTGLLTEAGDPRAPDHVLRLWATAHGLIALLAVDRVDPDPDQLHRLLGAALDDVLAALPAPREQPGEDLL